VIDERDPHGSERDAADSVVIGEPGRKRYSTPTVKKNDWMLVSV